MKPTRLGRGLAVALDQEQGVVEGLPLAALQLSGAEVAAAGEVWAALLGAAPRSRAAGAARREVAGDPALAVALHRPASELLQWWRGAAWWEFARCDSEGDAWAWAVCDALRAVVQQLGPLASQMPASARLVHLARQNRR